MILAADKSEQGIAKGNLEYSSIIVSINRFLDFDGKGPLKSRFNLSNGEVVFINLPSFLQNRGFNSLHIPQEFVMLLMSSREKGRFLDLTQWYIRVTPG